MERAEKKTEVMYDLRLPMYDLRFVFSTLLNFFNHLNQFFINEVPLNRAGIAGLQRYP
jgi:hypothetical protein